MPKNSFNPLTARSDFDEEFDALSVETQQLEVQLIPNKERLERLEYMRSIADALPMSWASEDPGKYGPAYSFLSPDGRVVVVQEFLPEEVTRFEGDSKAWNTYKQEHPHIRNYDILPPYINLVEKLEDVMHCACPSCGISGPVVQYYHQTYDSYDGDEWTKQLLVLCCDDVRIIESETSSSRF